MPEKKLKNLFLLLMAVLVTACGGRKAVVEAEPVADTAVPIGTVVVVPIRPPERLHTDNRSIPVIGFVSMGIANTIADKPKSAGFNEQYGDYREKAGDKLTRAVMRELQGQGFAVKLANPADVVRDKDGRLDLAKFPPKTHVMDALYYSMGMYSGRTTRDYVPQIGVNFELLPAGNDSKQEPYSQYYLLGGWANRDSDGYLLSDPKYAFPSFGALMEQADLVREAYDHGIEKLAKFMVRDLRVQYRPEAVATRSPEARAPATAKMDPKAETKKMPVRTRPAKATQAATGS